ncbi:hypothetical protein WL83_04075 [Burkholderia ubonensis]|nr:hypothetical protein WL83_04075 [Burkholderia ubonensis]
MRRSIHSKRPDAIAFLLTTTRCRQAINSASASFFPACTTRSSTSTLIPAALTPGTSYQVGDNAEPHQSYTRTGAKLFIVD